MSTIYGLLANQIVSFISSEIIYKYCIVASAALVLYDHICSIPREVQFIWGSKVTSTIILFHANRWLILAYAILSILVAFYRLRTDVSCAVLCYALDALELCLFALWAAFSGIRVYALSGGSRLLSFAVALLSLVPAGTNAYSFLYKVSYQLAALPVLGLQCLESLDITKTMNTRLAISTELCKMAADTVVIFITWLKTWSTIRMVREHNVKTPLMTMLLRDGTFYFLGLLSLNALNLAGQTTNVFSYASTFSTPLSAMIITHFPLSLRQLAHGSSDNTSRPSFVQDGTPDPVHSQTSSLRFGSFVGNMGESLRDGSEDDDRDVAWDNDVQNDVDDVRLDAQIIHDSSGVCSTPAPVSDPMPEDIVEGEKRLDQAANVGPLT